MTCKQVEQYWEHWLEGTAPPELERHLETCLHCRRQAAELARTSDWMGFLRQEPAQPGPAFWARLSRRLEEEEATADFWTALGWVAARTALALALLVVFLGVGVVLESSRQEPTPARAEFDAPEFYAAEGSSSVPVTARQFDRDRVVMTLVAYSESQQ